MNGKRRDLTTAPTLPARALEKILVRVVQRWVKFNPGLSKNYRSNCFSKEKIGVLIIYFSDFPWKKFVNVKLTYQICFFKAGNRTVG